MKKYELIEGETIEVHGVTLYKIRALRDLGSVKAGDVGGYVEKESNLAHGNAWVQTSSDYFSISPIGSENGTFTAYKTGNGIECNRGCFDGTLSGFEDAVTFTHGDNEYAKQYAVVIELVKLRLGGSDNDMA